MEKKKMAKRKKKQLPEIIAIVDTREQRPLLLEAYGVKTVRQKLNYGDYSLIQPDCRDHFVIERKASIDEFARNVTYERDRFERELRVLCNFRYKFIICEFRLSDVWNHRYSSLTSEKAIVSSITKWLMWGIPFIFAEGHEESSYIVAKLLLFHGKKLFIERRKKT